MTDYRLLRTMSRTNHQKVGSRRTVRRRSHLWDYKTDSESESAARQDGNHPAGTLIRFWPGLEFVLIWNKHLGSRTANSCTVAFDSVQFSRGSKVLAHAKPSRKLKAEQKWHHKQPLIQNHHPPTPRWSPKKTLRFWTQFSDRSSPVPWEWGVCETPWWWQFAPRPSQSLWHSANNRCIC